MTRAVFRAVSFVKVERDEDGAQRNEARVAVERRRECRQEEGGCVGEVTTVNSADATDAVDAFGRAVRVVRVVYVSRGDAGQRKVLREEDLIAQLKAIRLRGRQYGENDKHHDGHGSLRSLAIEVSVFVGSGMPLWAQVELFRRADVVVAPVGAALANLIHTRPGAALVILPIVGRDNSPYFEYLAAALGLTLWDVASDAYSPGIHSDYDMGTGAAMGVARVVRDAAEVVGARR